VRLILSYLKLLVLIVVFSFIVFADNCSSPSRILSQYSSINFPQSGYLLYPLVKDGHPDAIAALTKLAIDSNSQYWLSLAGKHGSSGALYYSAMRSKNAKNIRAWLKSSAELGHAQSQFEYALLQTSKDEKRHWMRLSAEAGYKPAIISMAKYSFESSDASKAIIWLEKASDFDALSAFNLANLYWKQENNEDAMRFFQKAAEQNFAPAKTTLQILQQNTMKDLDALLDVAPQGPDCAQTIQFAATSLASFVQANNFHDEFEKDKRLASLPICILPPIWLQKNVFECHHNFENTARLGCDLYPLSQLQTPLSFTHMVVFAEQGKANVNNGVMFLDQSDTYSVFVHELAHFAGFVDEYALPESLANYHCNKNEAPNLLTRAVEDETEGSEVFERVYLPQSRASTWAKALDAHNQLQSLESNNPVLHHIARSRTCKNINVESFKPTQQMTFLEYHDVPNIPKVYRTLWRQALQNRSHYSAINDNLAISAFANKDDQTGVFWSEL
jgi:tetratricopeptide (TPR) repeat protein